MKKEVIDACHIYEETGLEKKEKKKLIRTNVTGAPKSHKLQLISTASYSSLLVQHDGKTHTISKLGSYVPRYSNLSLKE